MARRIVGEQHRGEDLRRQEDTTQGGDRHHEVGELHEEREEEGDTAQDGGSATRGSDATRGGEGEDEQEQEDAGQDGGQLHEVRGHHDERAKDQEDEWMHHCKVVRNVVQHLSVLLHRDGVGHELQEHIASHGATQGPYCTSGTNWSFKYSG